VIVVSEPVVALCKCLCHNDPLGEFRALFHQGRYVEAMRVNRDMASNWEGVDVQSILEAAAACPKCLDQHCPALREEKPTREKAVWHDPPLVISPPPDETANPEE
jgi:hypothetical protein